MPTLYNINPRNKGILLLITCLHFPYIKKARRHDGPGFSGQKIRFSGSNSRLEAAYDAGLWVGHGVAQREEVCLG
jgi:hypothetical protein